MINFFKENLIPVLIMVTVFSIIFLVALLVPESELNCSETLLNAADHESLHETISEAISDGRTTLRECTVIDEKLDEIKNINSFDKVREKIST